MKNYKAIGKIGEGTFSEVTKMQSLRDGNYYACKQMKQHFESDRKSGSLALICELMDMNIYELIRGRRHPLSEKKIMNYMYQLCKSLDHMHRNGIFHRDVKPENILVKQDVLKLGDFGSCRSVYSTQPYTEYISTRWYRAPECLLTDGFYTYKMDLWSAGCVFYEIASLQPLFPGVNELDQISKIHDVIGTPCQKTLTKFKHVLFQEAAPEARGGPCQKTRASQLDGAAQTEAVRSDQTVIMFQPCTAVSAVPWSEQWKSPCVETLEVCWCEQEDRHAEGHQTSPETMSPAHDQQERGRILNSTPPGHPLGVQGQAHGQA
ncbi:MAPK/MAK/MRK overlapping kinase isoform X9 [Onychomys torridus]|uniref:MAPK/MAK/MRK overlapping kinase isoform X9 n=1 Tax=Onychomys torridus TaxID=38674 RepID=UPI00167F97C7|nr:MAPK/MAK/MRK overlapping kinase isoform X9 [Onychomys torridus]